MRLWQMKMVAVAFLLSLCVSLVFFSAFHLKPPYTLRAARRLVCFFFLTIFKLRKQMIQMLVAIPKSTKKTCSCICVSMVKFCFWFLMFYVLDRFFFFTLLLWSERMPCSPLYCLTKKWCMSIKMCAVCRGVCMVDWSC